MHKAGTYDVTVDPANFLAHPEAVPHFQIRLRDFYAATGQTLPWA